ncbi:MAG TPA: hypothetical protein VFR70_04470 [Flavobacterium sp.]|nr:hypothetical protein [Flavobacterium sp.]
MKAKNFLAGLGGAIVLSLLHESLKKKNGNMPRIDLVGEEAVQKTLGIFGSRIESRDKLYIAALIGDLASNAAYYSMIGNSPNHIWKKAISLGLAAGIGAVAVPKHIGLDDEPVARNTQVKLLTASYYLAGALATAAILTAIKSKKSQ